jgi:hypothetical protein
VDHAADQASVVRAKRGGEDFNVRPAQRQDLPEPPAGVEAEEDDELDVRRGDRDQAARFLAGQEPRTALALAEFTDTADGIRPRVQALEDREGEDPRQVRPLAICGRLADTFLDPGGVISASGRPPK